jgi:HEAT repeat protein
MSNTILKRFQRCVRPCHRLLLAVFFFSFVTTLLAFPASAQASLIVEWTEGRLSVSVEQASLAQILREVAHRTGIRILGLDGLQEKVSVRFSDLPLSKALHKLLANVDYVLIEESPRQEGPNPARVVVFGRRAVPHPVAVIRPVKEPMVEEDQGDDRLAGLHALARKADTGALREAMFDPDPTIQATAFELLAGLNYRGAVEALVDTTGSDQPDKRLQALQLLHHTGQANESTTLSTLGEALSDEDTTVQGYAIQALAELGTPNSLGTLRGGLRNPDPAIRTRIIESVIQSAPTEQSLPLLREALWDGDEAVRAIASTWLEQATADMGSDVPPFVENW